MDKITQKKQKICGEEACGEAERDRRGGGFYISQSVWCLFSSSLHGLHSVGRCERGQRRGRGGGVEEECGLRGGRESAEQARAGGGARRGCVEGANKELTPTEQ